MLNFLNSFRDITLLTIALRLILSVICGGIIGIERERKRRPAGFRTHILICLGAAMTTLTSEFLLLDMNYYTDIGRLGAQVIAGVGFIGAGTIIVTKRRQVKGLTTAAGLWTSAIIGLTIGAGYYEAGLLTTAIILLAEIFFTKFEYWILVNARDINLYIEYDDNESLDNVIRLIKLNRVVIVDMEITKSGENACAIFQLQLPKKIPRDKLFSEISSENGILTVEEL